MKKLILALLFCAFLFISFTSFQEKENRQNLLRTAAFSDENERLIFLNQLDSSEHADTSELDNPPSIGNELKDVSSMFNERGFYKSNGFSFDDQEIINDFNGNLIYSIPLYNFCVNSDFNLQMKLNYNGSVSHSVMVGSTTTIGNGNKYRYNFNFPEWIVELNGIAIQVFNFETNFFTNAGPNQYIYGSSINTLVAGYHYGNEMRPATSASPDKINILSGDGSIICLENTFASDNSIDTNNYRGLYEYKGKELYYKAIVTFTSTPSIPAYTPRKIILLKGDGLEYEFEEKHIEFEDLPSSSQVNYYLRPKVIYLKAIRDRFSHSISIAYDDKHPYSVSSNELIKGRHLLKSVSFTGASSTIPGASVLLEYGAGGCKMFHQSEINGNYTFYFDKPVSYRATDNNKLHRGQLKTLQNILNQKTEFSFSNYIRKYTNVSYPASGTFTLSLNNLQRMKSSKNNLGLTRHYQGYFGNDSMEIPLNLIGENEHITSSVDTNSYKGSGRDPFFSNMLTQKTDSTEVAKSKTTFEYGYSLGVLRDIREKPVDSSDRYRTTKIISSKESSTVNASDPSNKSIRQYRIYPLYDPNNHFAYSPDFDGNTKLIREDIFKNANESVFITNEFAYELGSYSSLPEGFNGSFLMKAKKEKYPGTSKQWQWSFLYYQNSYDKPVYQTTATDPLGNYSVTNDTLYDTNFWHRPFVSDYNYNSLYINSYYHQINLPKLESKYSQIGNLVQKKTYSYIEDTSSTLGYYGQLISEKSFNSINLADYVETNYEYYKHDTIGRHTFSGTGIFPYKEGNLKSVRTIDQESRYYYHPINLKEVVRGDAVGDEPPNLPKLKYKIKYDNGNVVETYEKIWDFRFPVRTDNYKITGNSRDTLSISYQTYTLDGSPSKIIDQNKYLTRFVYEPIHRINSITLPGDFSVNQDSVKLIINENILYNQLTILSNGWGYLNDLTHRVRYLRATNLEEMFSCNLLRTDMHWSGNYEHLAFSKFDGSFINQFVSIDSAIFEMHPVSYNAKYGNNTIDHGLFKTYLKPMINLSNVVTGCPCSGSNCDSASISETTTQDSIYLDLPNYNPTGYCYKKLTTRITNIVNQFHGSSSVINGLVLRPVYTGPETNPYPNFKFLVNFLLCEDEDELPSNWFSELSPRIHVYGYHDNSDTLKIPIIKGGTFKYYYDDLRHTVDVFSIRSTTENERSKIKYLIDAFGNVKQKNIYTSETDSNIFKYLFNYLNKSSRIFDPLSDTTMFSYDGLGRLKKTKNADTSSTENFYAYYDSLNNYFGSTYLGFIEKQTFKDEENNYFEKYFDAVGNLRRERKFIEGSIIGDDPPGY